jgi:hypothetical protein
LSVQFRPATGLVAVAALVAASAPLAPASTARAERVAVLPVRGSHEASARLRAQIQEAVVAALASAGDTPVAGAELDRALSRARVIGCASLDCAAAVRRATSAAAVVEVTLWTNDQGEARELVITRQDARGQEGTGSLPLSPRPTPDELRTAVREALARSLDTLTPEGGVEVSVRSRPVEAALSLDGRPLGRTPWRGTMTPGRHVLVAGAAGRRSVRRDLDIPSRSGTAMEVVVDLEADPEASGTEAAAATGAGALGPDPRGDGDADAPRDGRAPRGRNARPRASGGALGVLPPLGVAALGVALLAVDVAALLSTGCVTTDAAGACTRERSLEPVAFAVYGSLGLAALAGGIVWLALAIAGGGSDGARPSAWSSPRGAASPYAAGRAPGGPTAGAGGLHAARAPRLSLGPAATLEFGLGALRVNF